MNMTPNTKNSEPKYTKVAPGDLVICKPDILTCLKFSSCSRMGDWKRVKPV